MTISWPITAPTSKDPAHIVIRQGGAIGSISISPFTDEQEVQELQGGRWEADISLPPMKITTAEDWVGSLVALRGTVGTLLLGPFGTTKRGTWAGTPLVNGASQAGFTLACDGFAVGATGSIGDWLQLGSAGTTHLHKLTAAFIANGSGQATLDIWPRLRSSPADNAAITIASPKGIWRLKQMLEWDIGLAQTYGLKFSLIEAL